MSSPRIRLLVSALAVFALLVGAGLAKRRRARYRLSELRSVLPAGSVLVSHPTHVSPRARDPAARVLDGPPRMMHLDPARTNRSPYAGPVAPHVAWSFDASAPIVTAPVVLPDGRIVFGTLEGALLALSASGEQVFRVNVPDRVYSSPLLHAERIFVGSDGGQLTAYSTSGRREWSLRTNGDADTAPVVREDGSIVFAAGRVVYAVRASGSVLWRVRMDRKVYSSPAVGPDGTVYIGCQDDRLYGIGSDGSVKMQVELGNDVDSAPAVDDDGSVYVGTDGGEVVAVDPPHGNIRWRTSVGGFVRGSVTLTRTHAVVVGVYGPSPRVVSLDAATGAQVWSFSVRGNATASFGVHGSPVEDRDGHLYFGAQTDEVTSLTESGALRWKLALGGDIDAPVVLAADRTLYVASGDGKLTCLRDSP